MTTARSFRQEIGSDVLPIELVSIGGRVHGRMRRAPLRLSEPLKDVAALARALGLDDVDLLPEPKPRPADTGAAHLMVRIRDSQTVDKAAPDAAKLLAVLDETQAEGCYIYSFDSDVPASAYCRFFNPTVGLWEDAATGTAAGPLAAYLENQGMLAGDGLVVEQGTKMGRRSLIRLQLTPEPEISGAGIVLLRGSLRL